MISLFLCLFMLLISSLGMNCTATNESQLDRASVGTALMSNATAAAEIGDYEQINISSGERPENDGTFWILEGYDRIQLPRIGRLLQENQTSQDLLLPEELAVYSRGMPIQGRIEFSREQVPFQIPSESGINICIAPLSLAGYLAGDLGNVQLSEEAICTEAVVMDSAENDGQQRRPIYLSASLQIERPRGEAAFIRYMLLMEIDRLLPPLRPSSLRKERRSCKWKIASLQRMNSLRSI